MHISDDTSNFPFLKKLKQTFKSNSNFGNFVKWAAWHIHIHVYSLTLSSLCWDNVKMCFFQEEPLVVRLWILFQRVVRPPWQRGSKWIFRTFSLLNSNHFRMHCIHVHTFFYLKLIMLIDRNHHP